MVDTPAGAAGTFDDPAAQIEDPLKPQGGSGDLDQEIEDQVVELEHKGERAKLVPASALIEERRQRKDGAKRLTDQDAKIKDLERTNAQLTADIGKVMPLVTAISRRPDLLQEALGQTAPSTRQATTADPAADAEALDVAKELELFDAQGQPDIARAKRVIARQANMVRQQVDAAVRPVREMSVNDKAAKNQATLHQYVDAGKISQESLDAAYKMVPPQLLADDGVMSVLYYFAAGLDAEQGKTPKARTRAAEPVDEGAGDRRRPSEPILTEGAGRRSGNTPLSDIETIVARNRNLSTEQYRNHLKDVPDFGRPITLE